MTMTDVSTKPRKAKETKEHVNRDGEIVGDPPVRKFRVGNVTAAVWANEGVYSVTMQKSYKEGEEWKNTETLFHGDIMNAVKALERAEEFIARQR